VRALVLATSYPVRPLSVSGAFVREMLRGLVPRGWSFEVVTPAAAAPGGLAPDPGIEVVDAPYPGCRLRGGLAHHRGIPETLAAARQVGYAGPPGRKATEVLSKYIIVDMFAKAIQGMKPEDAVSWATGELKKVYET